MKMARKKKKINTKKAKTRKPILQKPNMVIRSEKDKQRKKRPNKKDLKKLLTD